MARRLSARGVQVLIVDVDARGGAAVATEIGGCFLEADVSQPGANEAAADRAVAEFGRLDLVLLNAGVGDDGVAIAELDIDRYHRTVAVNLDAVVFGLRAALTRMAGRGGVVVVTASLAGLHESPLTPIYAATKHAVVGLVRSIAPVAAASGTRVHAICPRFVDTAILAGHKHLLLEHGLAVLTVERVAAAVVDVIVPAEGPGGVWVLAPHEAVHRFDFPPVPDLTRHGATTQQGRRQKHHLGQP